MADEDFSGGTASSTTATIDKSAVTNPAPMAVYQSERWGVFTYTIPHLTPGGAYTVRLHFAELPFSSAGARVFNVAINGTTVLSSFDIFATAGAQDKALVEQFTSIADGTGTITMPTRRVQRTIRSPAASKLFQARAAPISAHRRRLLRRVWRRVGVPLIRWRWDR